MAEGTQRRLTTIVAADVAGYSRLIGADEEGTLVALQAHRNELIDGLITQHDGRVANTAGDSILMEFPSAVEAVRFAIAVQRGISVRNQDVATEQRIVFRIGINVGDVIVQGDDLLGDSVNIAARLETLAEPGGIALSANAHEYIEGKVDEQFTDGGEHEVKNIARPVQVWRWRRNGDDEVLSPATIEAPLPLPDKPSIAVLPFDNMSGDPEQEYFSDGISEDIITALSRFHQFDVTARNSSFTYKGQAVDVKRVSRELSVQYVLEGSVRRAGNRVRITAQLIEAASDRHIWAERYDRELDNIFAVQDEITERIAMAVAPELLSSDMAQARRKSIPELGVWELVARAIWYLTKFTEENNAESQALLAKAIALDPSDSRIYSTLATTYAMDGMYGWQRPQIESGVMATETAQKALDLDKEDEYAHLTLGTVLFMSKRHEEAIQRFETAIEINPNYSLALGMLGVTLIYTHRHDKAFDLLQKAMQLSPKDIQLPFYVVNIGVQQFLKGQYDEACAWADKALHENPNLPTAHRLMASAQGMLGNLPQAREAYQRLAKLLPGVTIATTLHGVPFAFDDDAVRYAEGLRRAGMPEE